MQHAPATRRRPPPSPSANPAGLQLSADLFAVAQIELLTGEIAAYYRKVFEKKDQIERVKAERSKKRKKEKAEAKTKRSREGGDLSSPQKKRAAAAAALGSEQAAAAAALTATGGGNGDASVDGPVTSPTTSNPASPPSESAVAQEGGSPTPAEPAEPGALMDMARISDVFSGSA